jgi:hypothetical protein
MICYLIFDRLGKFLAIFFFGRILLARGDFKLLNRLVAREFEFFLFSFLTMLATLFGLGKLL